MSSAVVIKTSQEKLHGRTRLNNTFCFILLCLGGVTMLFPLFWLITASLKTSDVIYTFPPQWFPKEFQWSNYGESLRIIQFPLRFFNTMVITVLSIVGQILSSVMVGYALSRIRFPGRKLWFYLIIGSMMLPGLVSLIPVFKLFTAIGWYNTWLPIIVPNFLGAPFYIFLTRQYMSTIPFSFDEAAKMDGAGHLKILAKVLMPMIKPVIAVIVIMQFQGSWNNYLQPLVYLIDPNKWTLSIAIAQFVVDNNRTEWNLFMAANVFYIIPSFIVYFVGQKYFMQGLGSLNSTGLK